MKGGTKKMIRFKTENGLHIVYAGTYRFAFYDLKNAWDFIFAVSGKDKR